MDRHRVWEKVKEEFFAVLPPTLFFFFALHVIALIRVLVARSEGIASSTTVSIAVASLILGKAVLIADLLPAINRYPREPLIYPVAWKTAIYLLVASLIHYLERILEFAREAGSLAAGYEKLVAEIVWPHFWAVEIVLVVLILMYCTMREIARVIGREKVIRLFFGPPPLPEF